MHFSNTLIALVAALPLIEAIPTNANLEHLRQNNRIKQVEAGPKQHGARALSRAHHRYGMKKRPEVEDAAARARAQAKSQASATSSSSASPVVGSVVATNMPDDKQYLVEVGIGDQTFLMNFDTGSSDTWVFSDLMKKDDPAGINGHTVYKTSHGQLLSGYTWSMTYLDKSGASGLVYADEIDIGGIKTLQAIEAASEVSEDFTDGYQDGLVGLALDVGNSCHPKSCNTFMTNAGPSMPSQLFTVTLNHNAPGDYDFGYIDPDKYVGSIAGAHLTKNDGGFWQWKAHGYAVGDNQYTTTYDAIADTGTTLILAPKEVVENYYSQVDGAKFDSSQGGWTYPCSATLPNFTVNVANIPRTIPGSIVTWQELSQWGEPGKCYGGIQDNEGADYLLLGDIYLKGLFVVFDVGNSVIGFAQRPDVPV